MLLRRNAQLERWCGRRPFVYGAFHPSGISDCIKAKVFMHLLKPEVRLPCDGPGWDLDFGGRKFSRWTDFGLFVDCKDKRICYASISERPPRERAVFLVCRKNRLIKERGCYHVIQESGRVSEKAARTGVRAKPRRYGRGGFRLCAVVGARTATGAAIGERVPAGGSELLCAGRTGRARSAVASATNLHNWLAQAIIPD